MKTIRDQVWLFVFCSVIAFPCNVYAQEDNDAQQGDGAPPPNEDPNDEAPDGAPGALTEENLVKRTQNGKLIHWGAQSFVLSLTPTDVVDSNYFMESVKRSAVTWNNTGITPEILVGAQPENIEVAEFDGVNAVFFVTDNWEFDPRFTILTFTHVDGSTGEILETDVAINAVNHEWRPETTGEPVHDLQNVLTHEFGHALGLPDFSHTDNATMYGYVIAGELIKRDLADLDLEASETIYNSEELLEADEEGGEASGGQGGCVQTSAPELLCIFGLFIPLILLRRKTARPHLVLICMGLLMAPPTLAQEEEDTDRPTESDDRDGTTLYVASVQDENNRLPASDVVVETRSGTVVKVRVPGQINGNVHSIAPHYDLPAPGYKIDLSRFKNIDSAQDKKSSDSQQVQAFIKTSANSGTVAKTIHREIPNIDSQRLPGVDLIMKDKDGVVYKVRTPGRQQGEITTMAIHHDVPQIGALSDLPPHAKPLHAIDGLEDKDL
jgi:hypothetical protein